MKKLVLEEFCDPTAPIREERRERWYWYGALGLLLVWPLLFYASLSPGEGRPRWSLPRLEMFGAFIPGMALALLVEAALGVLGGTRPRFWRMGMVSTVEHNATMPLAECAGALLLRLQEAGFQVQASPDMRSVEFSKASRFGESDFESHAFVGRAELEPAGEDTRLRLRLEFPNTVVLDTGEARALEGMAVRLCGAMAGLVTRDLPFSTMTGLGCGLLGLGLALLPGGRAHGVAWILAFSWTALGLSAVGVAESLLKPKQYLGLRLGVVGIGIALLPMAALMWLRLKS